MKMIIIMILTVILRISGCITEPQKPTSFSIQVSNAGITQGIKFRANVEFINHLGEDVMIFNLGCSCTDSTFTPRFVVERSVGPRWEIIGGPGCIDIYVQPTYLIGGRSFSTIACMYWESSLTGTFRLRFDIRERDSGESLLQEYLVSNPFSISK